MRSTLRTPLIALPVAVALSGCYRNAEFSVNDLDRMESYDEQGLAVHERSGRVEYYSAYNSVFVDTTDAESKHRNRYDAPVFARLTPAGLEVQDAEQRDVYDPRHITELRVRKLALERPAIMFGSAAAASLVAGSLTYLAVAKDCDNDAEWGCYGEGVTTLLVSAATFVTVFLLSIPLTATLKPDQQTAPPKTR